jgi:hypothetical protein
MITGVFEQQEHGTITRHTGELKITIPRHSWVLRTCRLFRWGVSFFFLMHWCCHFSACCHYSLFSLRAFLSLYTSSHHYYFGLELLGYGLEPGHPGML